LRAAVQGVEVLTLELEGARHDGPVRSRPRLAVPRDAQHLRILEDRDVEVHRLFGVAVEPEKRDDLLHRALAGANQWLIAKNHAAITGPRGPRPPGAGGADPDAGAGAGPYSGWNRYATCFT